MMFLNELKRFWIINLKKPKKSFIPLIFNVIIIIMLYLIFKENISQTYIFSYSIAWLLLTSQIGMLQDFSVEKKAKTIKYYFLERNTVVGVYISRYIISSTKYSILYYVFLKTLFYLNIFTKDIWFTDILLLCIGLYSFFAVVYIFSLSMILNKKINTGINLIRLITYFLILKTENKFLPLSYSVNKFADQIFANQHFSINDSLVIIFNSLFYCITGYTVCFILTNFLKNKIVD